MPPFDPCFPLRGSWMGHVSKPDEPGETLVGRAGQDFVTQLGHDVPCADQMLASAGGHPLELPRGPERLQRWRPEDRPRTGRDPSRRLVIAPATGCVHRGAFTGRWGAMSSLGCLNGGRGSGPPRFPAPTPPA